MDLTLILDYIIISIIASMTINSILRNYAKKYKILVDLPDRSRKFHKRPTPMTGGLGILASLLISGKLYIDLNNLSDSYFETKADISSINTSNKTRDKHLNAPDYFHTEKYPYLIFKSESLKMDGSEFVLIGNISIKEITKKEEIRFTYKDNVFEGRCVIYSNDYEIKKQKTREKSKILVKISVPVF